MHFVDLKKENPQIKGVLVTGVAGFIGFHTAKRLLDQNIPVVGIDNLDDYYDVELKKNRLDFLKAHKNSENFDMVIADICQKDQVDALAKRSISISHVIHLAAQAGVRYSLECPLKYGQVNLMGHLNILEFVRNFDIKHLLYASSSSVYGANEKLPFSVHDPVEQPMSLYAATKRSNELMSWSYSHLFKIPMTGLRFFTVYGPWGRPDMATYLFTKALYEGTPLRVFNGGNMTRNFTYVDDIVRGVLGALAYPPLEKEMAVPHKIYNLGNSKAEKLSTFIQVLENITGRKGNLVMEDIQAGDVPATVADISSARQELNFEPLTNIEEGLAHFVQWYKTYYQINEKA